MSRMPVPGALKRSLPVLGVLLALLFACAAPARAQVVADLTDPVGDDYGPGTYTYPSSTDFTPGAFDLVSFRVTDIGDSVRFEIGIAGAITNPWGAPDGYCLQSIDIFIDRDRMTGSGATWTLEGRNAEIGDRDAWERMIWVAPRFGGEFSPAVYEPSGLATSDGVTVAVDAAEQVIAVTVPETLVGAPEPGWSYIVAMLGQDGFATGRVRWVNAWGGPWNFGGGDDSAYDSNIIDLITSEGVSQEGMLSRYSPYQEVVPRLFATDDGSPPSFVSWYAAENAEAHRPLALMATVDDDVVARVWARYSVDGGPEHVTDFDRDLDDFFAWIPGARVLEGTLEYVLFATDGFDTVSSPADTTQPHVAAIGPDVTPPVPDAFALYPEVISPDGDQVNDETLCYLYYPEPVTVDAAVLDAQDATVRTLASGESWDEGWVFYVWDGRDDEGAVVPDGFYRLELDATDLAGRTASVADTVIVELDPGDRQLEVILLFHYNQSLVPYSRIGNISCYYGLTDVLRRHPESHFPLHLSGTLLQCLQWFDPETVELVRQGVDDGQFEIVGSTYAQNIMYSTRSDSLDFQQNEAQIRLHRELIEEIFGVAPTTFWNAERVWTQNFVELLTRNGYRSAQIEDYLLERAGATGSEYQVRTTSYDGDSLVVFNDDKSILGAVDYAVATGDTSNVLSFLRGIWTTDVDDRFAVCYFQDAEATGLWDYEAGHSPQNDWNHLDQLLTAIESDPRIRLVTFEEWLAENEPSEHLPQIPDGAADWMGRDGWFSLNESELLVGFRQLFDTVRDSLNAVQSLIDAADPADTAAASALLKHAWRTFSAHQYEFGVVGYGGLMSEFEMIRTALVPARAARHALAGESAVYQEDVNQDGVTETVIVGPGDMAVLTPVGGRLLYWFDLEHGVELVGNENFFFYGESWVHDSWRVPLLRGGYNVYGQLNGNTVFPEVFDWTFEIRRRGLADSLAVGGINMGNIALATFDVTPLADGVRFEHQFTRAHLTKEVRMETPGELVVDYGVSDATGGVVLQVENGLSPDLPTIMDRGRGTLAWWAGDIADSFSPDVTGVLNTLTGDRVEVTGPSAPKGREVVFGRLISHTFTDPAPGDSVGFRMRLTRTHDETTPVAPVALWAAPVTGGIRIEWRVEDPSAWAGFHLWRAPSDGGADRRITSAPISSAAEGVYLDAEAEAGERYAYTLEGLARTGESVRFGPVTASAVRSRVALLHPPAPNPFRAGTSLSFELPARTDPPVPYRVEVFDARGGRVRTLARGLWGPQALVRSVFWDGRDERGAEAPSGVYFLRLSAGGMESIRKAVRLR